MADYTTNLQLQNFSSGDLISASTFNNNNQIIDNAITKIQEESMNAQIVGTVSDGGSKGVFVITLPTIDYDFLTINIKSPNFAYFRAYTESAASLTIPLNNNIYTVKKPSSTYTFYIQTQDFRVSSGNMTQNTSSACTLNENTLTLTGFTANYSYNYESYPVYHCIEVVQYKYK